MTTWLPMTEPSFRKMLTGIAEFYCARDYLTRRDSIVQFRSLAFDVSYQNVRLPRDMMRARVPPPGLQVLSSEVAARSHCCRLMP